MHTTLLFALPAALVFALEDFDAGKYENGRKWLPEAADPENVACNVTVPHHGTWLQDTVDAVQNYYTL